MSPWVMVVACLAGGAGAVARWLIDTAITTRVRTSFPLAIFCINVVGSFALGIVVSLLGASDIAIIVGTGFLGGFTTFSTAMLESARLLMERQALTAVLLTTAMLVACVLASAVGFWIAS